MVVAGILVFLAFLVLGFGMFILLSPSGGLVIPWEELTEEEKSEWE